MALEDAKTVVDDAFTRASLRGASFENTFGGATSFLRRRYTKDLTGAQIAVTGVPFDQAVTNRPGTRLGPRAIREATTLMAFDRPYGWDFNGPAPFQVKRNRLFVVEISHDKLTPWPDPIRLERRSS